MDSAWWSIFSAHLAAIVIGGTKVILISWLLWYLFRKRFVKKFVGGMMKDMMAEVLPMVQGLDSQKAHGPTAGFVPAVPGVGGRPVEFCPHCDGTGIKDSRVAHAVINPFKAEVEDQRPS